MRATVVPILVRVPTFSLGLEVYLRAFRMFNSRATPRMNHHDAVSSAESEFLAH